MARVRPKAGKSESVSPELAEAHAREAALADVLAAMAKTPLELQPVLEAAIEHAARLCHADWGFLDRLEGEFQRRVAVSSGAPPDQHAEIVTGATISMWNFGRAVIEKRPVTTADFLNDPNFATAPDWVRMWRSRHPLLWTGLGVPLIRGREAVGVMGLWRSDHRDFTEREVSLVKTFADQAVIAIENVRLFNETKEALERQTATSEVLKVMTSSTFDLDPIFATVVERALSLCGGDIAWISRRTDDRFTNVAFAGTDADRAVFAARRREQPHGFAVSEPSVMGRCLTTCRVVEVADIQADAALGPTSMTALRIGARTMLAVPMLRGGEAIGGIIVARKHVRPFPQRAIELVAMFAAQAVIAIENVRLFNETREALERQTAISEILRIISSSPTDVQPVLNTIAESAAQYCGADDAAVVLLRDDGTMVLTGTQGGRAQVPQPFAMLRRFVTPRAMNEARIYNIPDMEQLSDDEFGDGKVYAREHGYRGFLAAPLLKDGQAIGAIQLRRNSPGAFSPAQVELVQTFAAQAVIAIENVRLFNETREALGQQTATAEVLKTISRSAFDLQGVLDTVVQNAAQLCAADRCVLWRLQDDGYRMGAHWGAFPSGVLEDLAAGAQRPGESDTVVTRAAASRRPVQVKDVLQEPHYTVGSGAGPSGLARSRLGVPLLRDGEPIGALSLTRSEVRAFTEKEIGLVATFADQAVIAIENARLIGEIQEKSIQLEDASRHKSEFLANMSHELRTPLNAIIGFSDVLSQRMFGELNEQQADYVRDIAGSGRHLLALVNEILDLAKVEAGRMELEPTTFALADTIHGALAFVRERASSQRIELAASLPDDLGTVAADERKIRQVLLNLLSNAVKFTPDGGRVSVAARRTAAGVEVSVRDTGIGIAPADQPRVFEEFRQVGRSSEQSREGTGLGLTLAKRFVELHGGRIWLESEVGRGTTFVFELPAERKT